MYFDSLDRKEDKITSETFLDEYNMEIQHGDCEIVNTRLAS